MIDQDLNSARFDAYLFNEMDADACAKFETDLMSDPILVKEFTEHKKFLDDLQEGMEYRELNKNFNAIHKSIYHPEKNFFTSRQFLIPVAIAASVVLIILAINPFVHMGAEESGTLSSNDVTMDKYASDTSSAEMTDDGYDTQPTAVYEMEMTEEEKIASPDLLGNVKDVPVGTAFMISKDGYFLTSKELVEGKKIVRLQNREVGLTFEAEVVYVDSLKDFALLKCNQNVTSNFKAIPYRFATKKCQEDDKVFTLGYPDVQQIMIESVISSEKGYLLDTTSVELPRTFDNGYVGEPVFTYAGDLIGIMSKKIDRKQTVTYVLDHHYIQIRLDALKENGIEFVNMSQNYNIRPKNHDDLVKWYKPYIFEVHP